MPFTCLPHQDKCCFCVKNLNLACCLIAVYYLLLYPAAAYSVLYPKCRALYAGGGALGALLAFWQYVALCVGLVFYITAIMFLLSLFKEWWWVSDVFIVMIFAYSVAELLYFVLGTMRVHLTDNECEQDKKFFHGSFIGSAISILVSTYFAIIINSNASAG